MAASSNTVQTLTASSLFLSRFPKDTASAADVEQFLLQNFPNAVAINVLRGPQEGSHKGQAYVHFRSADEAEREAQRIEASGGLPWRHPSASTDLSTDNPDGHGDNERESNPSAASSPVIFLRIHSRSLVSSATEAATATLNSRRDGGNKDKPSTIECTSSKRNGQERRDRDDKDDEEEEKVSRWNTSLFTDISVWDGVPLPPQCLGFPYTCCAYYLAGRTSEPLCNIDDKGSLPHVIEREREEHSAKDPSEGTEPINAKDQDGSQAQSPPPCNAKQRLIAFPTTSNRRHSTLPASPVEVLLFDSEAEREAALKAFPTNLAPCGSPSLEMIMRVPRDVTPERYHRLCFNHASHSVVKRRRTPPSEDVWLPSPPSKSVRLDGNEDDNSLVPVTPSEVFAMLQDFTEGRGRIAVKDQRGNIAVIKLPGYVSSL